MKKVGIIIADVEEYKPLEKAITRYHAKPAVLGGKKAHTFSMKCKSGEAEVTAVLCGIGKVNAACAAAMLCERGAEIILNCGLSGGISGVQRNDLCVPIRFLEHDFDMTSLGFAPCQKPNQEKYIYNSDEELNRIFRSQLSNIFGGTAVTGDCFVQNEQLRISLKENFGATSCDMETAAIASVCDGYSVKFACIRKISDDAGDDAGTTYRQLNVLNEDTLVKAVLSVIEEI